jgi:hypothetical protein
MATAGNVRELPPCTCIDFGDGLVFTLSCPRHDPFCGLLTRRAQRAPADFTGLLSMLEGWEPPSA